MKEQLSIPMLPMIPPQCRYIFSGNFLDRASHFPWLVRRADQPLCQCVPCMFVEARHVIFTTSGLEEQKQGCKLTATMNVQGREGVRFGNTFQGRQILPLEPMEENAASPDLLKAAREALDLHTMRTGFVRLRFTPDGFKVESTGEPVESVGILRLNIDGSISAVLQPTPAFENNNSPSA